METMGEKRLMGEDETRWGRMAAVCRVLLQFSKLWQDTVLALYHFYEWRAIFGTGAQYLRTLEQARNI
jgi:hypothetical protein